MPTGYGAGTAGGSDGCSIRRGARVPPTHLFEVSRIVVADCRARKSRYTWLVAMTPSLSPRLWVGLAILLVACAQPAGREVGRPADNQPTTRGPKILTIGVQRGVPSFSPYTGFSVSTSASSITPMLTDGLAYQDDRGEYHPLMAVELPSIEKGTWRIFDDGTMETTWRMK